MNLGEKINLLSLDDRRGCLQQAFGALGKDQDIHDLIATNEAASPIMAIKGNHLNIWRVLQKWPFDILLPREGDEVGAVFG